MSHPSHNSELHKKSISIHNFWEKVYTKLLRICKNTILQIHDWLFHSYQFSEFYTNELNLTIASRSENFIFKNDTWLVEVSNHFMSHRFDLLGSGWTKVYFGMKFRGLEEIHYSTANHPSPDVLGNWLKGLINRSNLAKSQSIWNLIEQPYTPIDWQIDFKSGYRWNEKTWFTNIQFGHKTGVDIKVPWELARMQHLPLLAKAYSFAQKQLNGFSDPEVYIKELQNQILDFIATNPPRWGVNWASTMDVSIRIINWLLAYDLFTAFGAKFDDSFSKIFFNSVYEHGNHISNHLEWHPKYRNNHYLSNIVGLLFVAAYLPSTKKTNSWLIFSTKELINEIKLQFHEDGSNFEASTCYHRLSSEFAIYATALILGLSAEKRQALRNNGSKFSRYSEKSKIMFHPLPNSNDESPFPDWYFDRLEKMVEFTQKITKPDGHIPQIGDNDSGRLVKLFPIYRKMEVKTAKENYLNLSTFSELQDQDNYWMEDFLDHSNMVSAFCGLFIHSDYDNFGVNDEEKLFIRALSRGTKVNITNSSSVIIKPGITDKSSSEDWQNCDLLLSRYSPSEIITNIHFDNSINSDSLDYFSYSDFGLFICKSKEFYLSIRCGSVGQRGNGGHAHNDQLSIELFVNGKNIIADPGSYLYSPLVNRRNEYRSVFSHFAPHIMSKEPSDLTKGIFSLNDPKAEVLYFGKKGFVGCHEGYGFKVYRRITITDFDIIISDYS
ncbi:MAG TPA: hypothetical protein DEG92_00650, partial [Rikenellaceae bacterium]|nr:hypothetical protein [Rikenellaceae bacterium]